MLIPGLLLAREGKADGSLSPPGPSHLVSIMYLFVLGVVLVRDRIQRDTLPPPPA